MSPLILAGTTLFFHHAPKSLFFPVCLFFVVFLIFFFRLPYVLVSFFFKTKRKPAEIKTERYGRQLRCIPD